MGNHMIALAQVASGRVGLGDQIAEQVRQEARAAQVEAQAARIEAQQAAREAMQDLQHEGIAPPPPPEAPGVTIRKDGRTIHVGPDGIRDIGPTQNTEAVIAQSPFPPPPMVPEEAVIISIAFFIMLAVIAIGWPLARAFARRIDRQSAQPRIPTEVSEQLGRLEQAVDTMAVEIERISEGQRFSSRLLSEMHPILRRSADGVPALLEPKAGGEAR